MPDESGMSATEEDLEVTDLASFATKNKVLVLEMTMSLKELHTVLKDKTTDQSTFTFNADRLMRLVIEAGLNLLPYKEASVQTPSYIPHHGIHFVRGNCGVALCRSGEAMELALRQCCRSIRICKLLIDGGRVLYARVTHDIAERRCLLLYPIVTKGQTTVKAIHTLVKHHGVPEDKIYLISLFASPSGITAIRDRFPDIHIITSEITQHIIKNFAQRYYGSV